MEDKFERNFWSGITVINLLLAFFMVVYHNEAYGLYNGVSDSVKRGIDIYRIGIISNVCVPMFIMLSGFLFYRELDYTKLEKKLKKRVYSLVIPYIIWNAITGVFFLILQNIPFIASKMQGRKFLEYDFISIIKGITIEPYAGQLWTILQLIIFVILAPEIFALLKNKISGAVTLVVVLLWSIFGPDVFFIIHGRMHLLTYLIGAYLGIHLYEKIVKIHYTVVHLVIALSILITCGILYETIFRNDWILYVVIPCIWTIVMYLCSRYNEKHTSKFKWYGLSFCIYVCWGMIQPCVEKIWLIMGPGGNAGALIDIIFVPIVVSALIIGIALFFRKFMPKLFGVLSGGR